MNDFLDDSVKNEILSSLEMREESKTKIANESSYKYLIIKQRRKELDERSF